MNKLSRKDREKLARKESIIDAAEEIIKLKGFKNSTMDEIAEKAELGKGTLYLYFNSKTSIYLAICDRGSRLLNQKMAKVITMNIKGIGMVKEMGHVYLNFIQSYPIYFNAFNFFESSLSEDKLVESAIVDDLQEHSVEAMTYVVRALQIGMQDGSIRNTYDPKELGIIFWGASRGVIQVAFMKENRKSLKILNDVTFSLESLVNSFIYII
jgi:AcrR family transcriptional regulator